MNIIQTNQKNTSGQIIDVYSGDKVNEQSLVQLLNHSSFNEKQKAILENNVYRGLSAIQQQSSSLESNNVHARISEEQENRNILNSTASGLGTFSGPSPCKHGPYTNMHGVSQGVIQGYIAQSSHQDSTPEKPEASPAERLEPAILEHQEQTMNLTGSIHPRPAKELLPNAQSHFNNSLVDSDHVIYSKVPHQNLSSIDYNSSECHHNSQNPRLQTQDRRTYSFAPSTLNHNFESHNENYLQGSGIQVMEMQASRRSEQPPAEQDEHVEPGLREQPVSDVRVLYYQNAPMISQEEARQSLNTGQETMRFKHTSMHTAEDVSSQKDKESRGYCSTMKGPTRNMNVGELVYLPTTLASTQQLPNLVVSPAHTNPFYNTSGNPLDQDVAAVNSKSLAGTLTQSQKLSTVSKMPVIVDILKQELLSCKR